MTDRAAPSAGVAVAGVALAAGALPWPAGYGRIAAAFALVALAAFALGRHGRLERRLAATIAGAGAVGVVVTAAGAGVASAAGSDAAAVGLGPALGASAGVLAAALAHADRRGVSGERLGRMALATARAAAVGSAGLLAIVVWSAIIGALLRATGSGRIDPSTGTALSTLALGLGTGSVAAAYLAWSDRDRSFIDLARPGVRDLAYVVGGVVTIVGLNLAIAWGFRRLGLESASHTVIEAAESDPQILLVLIPLSYLIIGPGEELLYRNVVQKSLYGVFSRRGAVVVASAVFAGVHVFAYSGGGRSALATVNTLLVIFVLALVLGAIYERTGNLVVPALVHGSFNAIAFAVTYAQLTGLVG